MNTNS